MDDLLRGICVVEGAALVVTRRLGQHTHEVLSTVLGLDSGAIARLHDTGVVA